jgi:hypothetical protein
MTQKWLSCFDGSANAIVGIGPSNETFLVKDFPLPDKYQPDRLSLVLEVRSYPQDPPKGIYLLTTETNRSLIDSLKRKFNVFQNTAFHGAESIQGYEWICVGYLNGWKFNAQAPHKGDNICKMLKHFWRLLEE